LEKFYISEIVAVLLTKFAEFTDEIQFKYPANFIKITNTV